MEAGENRRSRPQQDFLPINVNEIEYGRGPAGVHKKTCILLLQILRTNQLLTN